MITSYLYMAVVGLIFTLMGLTIPVWFWFVPAAGYAIGYVARFIVWVINTLL